MMFGSQPSSRVSLTVKLWKPALVRLSSHFHGATLETAADSFAAVDVAGEETRQHQAQNLLF